MVRSTQAVSFPGATGHALAARLDTPPGAPPRAYALFAHCFTGSKESKAATFISEALTDAGIAVLRFDLTGLGGSESAFANTTFSSNVGDLVAAAAWLKRERAAPAILVGHSLGGAAVLAAASRIPEAVAVATINAPADPALARDVAGLDRALMVFHAPGDTTVGIDNASRIFRAAKHPKSFVSLDAADHLLTRRSDARYVGAALAAWASRYLGLTAAGAPESEPATGTVRVRETGAGKFQQEIAVGPHRLLADEPVAAGGDDSGPSPYDLLCAALGACTAMTLRLYAQARGIPLERVTVELHHAKIHAEDCSECETREGRIDRIERVIELEGALDAAVRAKLLEIADKCPVHRTLHSEVMVATRLA